MRIMHIMLNRFWWPVDNFCLSIQQVRRGVVDNFEWDAYKSYYVKLVGGLQEPSRTLHVHPGQVPSNPTDRYSDLVLVFLIVLIV